ncbi:DUF2975 domain-containing protein [Rufibacter latericius]|uniref:DUF2975 domain-containing protein n=1 Tax=Rufibacter latericius TaxID=2487040 RepID=A0A3M9MA22_9BACT|nr:DUF2975 domain-containing protein [Rufibacter latericius]RNI22356.1 DUF2975 domain-containing protein [Rufibacter latericius]
MKTKTNLILSTVNVLFWIVYIGLCIKTGAILISFLVSLFVSPQGAQDLHLGLDLSELLRYSKQYYISMVSLIIVLSALKAHMAYLVIRVFMKIDPLHPFNATASGLITTISEVALGSGILAIICNAYAKWLTKMPVDLQNLTPYLDNGGEFLFLAGIIFVIAQIFKKGVEIQSENELTI